MIKQLLIVIFMSVISTQPLTAMDKGSFAITADLGNVFATLQGKLIGKKVREGQIRIFLHQAANVMRLLLKHDGSLTREQIIAYIKSTGLRFLNKEVTKFIKDFKKIAQDDKPETLIAKERLIVTFISDLIVKLISQQKRSDSLPRRHANKYFEDDFSLVRVANPLDCSDDEEEVGFEGEFEEGEVAEVSYGLAQLYNLLINGNDGNFWKDVNFDGVNKILRINQPSGLKRIYSLMMVRKRILYGEDREVIVFDRQKGESNKTFKERLLRAISGECNKERVANEPCVEKYFPKLLRVSQQLREAITLGVNDDDSFATGGFYVLLKRAHDLIDCCLDFKYLQNSPLEFSRIITFSEHFTLKKDLKSLENYIDSLFAFLPYLEGRSLKMVVDDEEWDSMIRIYGEMHGSWEDDYRSLINQGSCDEKGWECTGDAFFRIQDGYAQDAERDEENSGLFGKDSRNHKASKGLAVKKVGHQSKNVLDVDSQGEVDELAKRLAEVEITQRDSRYVSSSSRTTSRRSHSVRKNRSVNQSSALGAANYVLKREKALCKAGQPIVYQAPRFVNDSYWNDIF